MMKGYVLGSVRPGSGKTTLAAGLAMVLGKEKVAYFKPLGDHLVYRKKKLWDLDGALLKAILESECESDEMTVGFDHSKMRYMHQRDALQAEVKKRGETLGSGKDFLLVEGPGSFEFGYSLELDSVSLSKYLNFPFILLVRGSTTQMLDDATFAKRVVDAAEAKFMGVVVNDVHNAQTIREELLDELEQRDIPVLGLLDYRAGLTTTRVSFLAERLFAKVIAGESGLANNVSQVFIGAMAASHARRHPGWKDPQKLIITAGDRDDLIAAAVDDGASCLVLTNDLVPSPSILAKADLKGIPIMQVPTDTYNTVRKIEAIEKVILPDELDKIAIAQEMVEASGIAERLI